jgi:putative ABC transport system ATP-binding protein
LLADEPTANLDSKTTTELLEVLRQLNQQQGMTIVTATHDPIVMGYTSRQVVMMDGEIHQDSASAA